jgi:hypothetical protein
VDAAPEFAALYDARELAENVGRDERRDPDKMPAREGVTRSREGFAVAAQCPGARELGDERHTR